MAHYVGVFISHSWAYTDHYKKLAEWFFVEKWDVQGTPIIFVDYSIPEDNPIHNAPNQQVLFNVIAGEIAKCHIVVCPTGMYANHSNWIDKELDAARALGKKVLAVDPWGQQRTSSVVWSRADGTSGWSKEGVVTTAWQLFLNS